MGKKLLCAHKANCSIPLLFLSILFLFSSSLQGCSGNNQTEEEIRNFVREAEISIENSDIGETRDLIAEDYTDPSGRSKRDLIQYLTYQVLRKRAIHLFISISDITFPDARTAKVEFVAAMTGAPVESKNALRDLQADLYSFTCTLTLIDKDWKLSTAEWKPARIEDLFPQ